MIIRARKRASYLKSVSQSIYLPELMKSSDIKLGQRVRVATNDMTALVVGRPEYYTPQPSYPN